MTGIQATYKRLGISDDILEEQVIVTADTGFANEDNNRYLKESNINAYIPDNQFRSRDPRYAKQKTKYGKRQLETLKGVKKTIPTSDFTFNHKKQTASCPAGKDLWFKSEAKDDNGNIRLFFEGKLTDCRHCDLKYQCMRNPQSADNRKGHGRQVSTLVKINLTATDWMKRRVDSQFGKEVYSHRMSVVEPVFGNIGTNKRLNRFSLRGKDKVQGQWRLFCLVHNIEKLARYGQIG